MPNNPMATGTTLKPSSNSVTPNVKRGAPTTGSMPTMAISSPKTAAISARSSDFPASPVTRERPNTISAKNSGGPNRNARAVRGNATRTSPMIATVPAKKDPIAATANAGPARPCLAIG